MFIQKNLFHTCLLAINKPQLTAFGEVDDGVQGPPCLAGEGLLHGFGLVFLPFLALAFLPFLPLLFHLFGGLGTP